MVKKYFQYNKVAGDKYQVGVTNDQDERCCFIDKVGVLEIDVDEQFVQAENPNLLISKSVFGNGIVVPSRNRGIGISGKDWQGSEGDRLSVNLSRKSLLEGESEKDTVDTLFYNPSIGVFPVAIEHKDGAAIEITEQVVEDELNKLDKPAELAILAESGKDEKYVGNLDSDSVLFSHVVRL